MEMIRVYPPAYIVMYSYSLRTGSHYGDMQVHLFFPGGPS